MGGHLFYIFVYPLLSKLAAMLRNLLLLLAVSGAFSCYAQKESDRLPKATEKPKDSQTDYKQVGSPLPPFRLFVCRDSSDDKRQEIITNKQLKSKGNTFIMIFNPTCSHCEEET